MKSKSNIAKYMRQRRAKLRALVYSHYGYVCNCCGEAQDMFLTIDHVNNDGHKDKSPSGYKATSDTLWLKIIQENFPDKYQILCYNCNIGKRINGGTCPHENI